MESPRKNVYELTVDGRIVRARRGSDGWVGSVHPPRVQTETAAGERQIVLQDTAYGPHPDRFCALAAAINAATDDVELRRAARAEAGIR